MYHSAHVIASIDQFDFVYISIWMMNVCKINTGIAFFKKNMFQDINFSYYLQTIFNWIKDLLIWAHSAVCAVLGSGLQIISIDVKVSLLFYPHHVTQLPYLSQALMIPIQSSQRSDSHNNQFIQWNCFYSSSFCTHQPILCLEIQLMSMRSP